MMRRFDLPSLDTAVEMTFTEHTLIRARVAGATRIYPELLQGGIRVCQTAKARPGLQGL